MKFLGAIILAALAGANALTIQGAKKQIAGLTKENFDATLKEIEPFLTKEAGATIYAKSMKRIAVQADLLGASVPADYAKDAEATRKRRERQDAYVKAKIAEAADAVEEEPETDAAEEGEASE